MFRCSRYPAKGMRPLSVNTACKMHKINTWEKIGAYLTQVGFGRHTHTCWAETLSAFVLSKMFSLSLRSGFPPETYYRPFPLSPAKSLHILLASLLPGKTWQSFSFLFFFLVYLPCIVPLSPAHRLCVRGQCLTCPILQTVYCPVFRIFSREGVPFPLNFVFKLLI